jgi:hypothetical protein
MPAYLPILMDNQFKIFSFTNNNVFSVNLPIIRKVFSIRQAFPSTTLMLPWLFELLCEFHTLWQFAIFSRCSKRKNWGKDF